MPPTEHVLDLSVGFRPLPQTTRRKASSALIYHPSKIAPRLFRYAVLPLPELSAPCARFCRRPHARRCGATRYERRRRAPALPRVEPARLRARHLPRLRQRLIRNPKHTFLTHSLTRNTAHRSPPITPSKMLTTRPRIVPRLRARSRRSPSATSPARWRRRWSTSARSSRFSASRCASRRPTSNLTPRPGERDPRIDRPRFRPGSESATADLRQIEPFDRAAAGAGSPTSRRPRTSARSAALP